MNMTVLIVEGTDLSGKTTAIEKISKYFKDGLLIKNLYKPKTYPDQEIYSQYWKIFAMYKSFMGHDYFLILDRFFPSQAVYSILRGKDEMFSHDIKELDEFCSSEDFIFVLLDTNVEELEKRYDKRGDEHIQKKDLTIFHERYEIFFNTTKMKKIKINTLNTDWLETLEKFINKNKGV